MKKKTSKATAFLGRRGSYSTHGTARGRVDVLPPEAIESVFVSEGLDSLRRCLVEQKELIEDRMAQLKKMRDQMEPGEYASVFKGLSDTYNSANAQIGHLNKILKIARRVPQSFCYQIVSEAMLDHQTAKKIRLEAESLQGECLPSGYIEEGNVRVVRNSRGAIIRLEVDI